VNLKIALVSQNMEINIKQNAQTQVEAIK